MADRKYKGELIRECADVSGAHRGRWIVQTHHEGTGNPWSDEHCPHYQTLSEARAAIDIVARELAR